MTLTNAAGESALVSLPGALSAVLASDGAASVPKAAELMTLDTVQYPHGVLVWAIQVVPEGGYIPANPPSPVPGMTTATTMPSTADQSNYEVDFVDARTGKWLQAIQSYDPALGPPPG
jgi:hypothetical protein